MNAVTPDYRRTKLSALRELANAGNREAARELERRGEDPGAAHDIATLPDEALRALVFAWREGLTPDERARSLDRAQRAHFELECRYRVDLALYEQHRDRPHPRQPPTARWRETQTTARCHGWQRPRESTHYRDN